MICFVCLYISVQMLKLAFSVNGHEIISAMIPGSSTKKTHSIYFLCSTYTCVLNECNVTNVSIHINCLKNKLAV